MAKNVQQVIDRLSARWAETQSQPSLQCKLGREPPSRRGDVCSGCTVKRQFELDEEIARLIAKKTFTQPPACPYRVLSNHLSAGLLFGREAIRSRGRRPMRIDPVRELKLALKHVGAVLSTTTLPPEDIEALIGDEADWQVYRLAAEAQRQLGIALKLVQQLERTTALRKPQGRTGEREIQAVVRAMAMGWMALTASLPAKENRSFHDLLSSATVTVFGELLKEPNWEAATQTARQRIIRDLANRTS